ncbi:MAG: hypothetical protein E7Y34_00845, partial [Mycoplasma sp.]|nr:hypothetical protein [Mycoplasma sp.]
RKTYANLPRPLLNRKHYVVSKTINYFDDISKVLKSEDEVLKIIKEFENSDKTLWICGGKSVYQNYYKYAKEIFVSRLNNSYIGDTYLDLDFDLIKKNKDVLSKDQELTIYKYY